MTVTEIRESELFYRTLKRGIEKQFRSGHKVWTLNAVVDGSFCSDENEREKYRRAGYGTGGRINQLLAERRHKQEELFSEIERKDTQ